MVPDVRDRQDDLLGERAVALDAEADRVRAEVPAAGPAVAAAAADDVALAADDVAGREVADVAADLEHLADELVADDERRLDRLLGPRIPVGDVEVGAADAGLVDADPDVVDADIGGFRDVRSSRPGPAVVLTSACITRAYSDGPVAGGAVGGRGARSPLVRVRPVDDRVLDRADALDLAADAVTRLEEDRRVAEDADA